LDPLIRRVSAWDGLQIHVRVWEGDPDRTPILCLPGLVRTSGDFETLIPLIAAGRRAISLDYLGRGNSAWPRDLSRCSPEACMGDVLDVCAALHVHQALVIGTSFGGLMAMGLAAARPSLVRAVVLNDIGPDIAAEGADFVRNFVGFDPALPSLEACIDLLREKLPPLSLDTDEGWRSMASLTYRRGSDGRFHPLWDTRLAAMMTETARDLWPLWRALAHAPVLLVRGGVSDLLLSEAVARMQAERPDMRVVTVPGVGHAPILTEPPALAAIRAFAEAHA